jgi:hypothetical protein
VTDDNRTPARPIPTSWLMLLQLVNECRLIVGRKRFASAAAISLLVACGGGKPRRSASEPFQKSSAAIVDVTVTVVDTANVAQPSGARGVCRRGRRRG